MTDAVEGAHMGHPDFRAANGRIFATLHPGFATGMVKLTPDLQQDVVRAHPAIFSPEAGAWGRSGCTRVTLAAADDETVGEAMTLAWKQVTAMKAAAAKKKTAKKASKAAKTPKARSAKRPSRT